MTQKRMFTDTFAKVVRPIFIAGLALSLAVFASPALLASNGSYLNVSSITPTANALDVGRASNVVVQFDHNINGATVTEDTFNVDGSISGEVSGSYYGGGTATITFDPASDLEVGETVTVSLTTAIEGEDGRTLEEPFTWQFVVETLGCCYFTDSAQSLGTSDSLGVSLGDVDGDGDLDAFVADWGANRVWLYGDCLIGYHQGYQEGHDTGYQEGHGQGYREGYQAGQNACDECDKEVVAVGGTVEPVEISELRATEQPYNTDSSDSFIYIGLGIGLAAVIVVGGGLLALRRRRAH